MPSKPIINMKEFIRAHTSNDNVLKRYAATKRGLEALSDSVVEDLADRAAISLKATNCRARIEFCRAARKRLKSVMSPTSREPAYFLTLAPDIFVTPLEQAHLYDWSELQKWANDVLAGFDYFGIVDAAPYTNTPSSTTQRVVSWHIHAIILNAERAKVAALVKRVNAQYRVFLPGRKAAHYSARLSWMSALSRITYALKAPLRTYRVYPKKNDLGELTGKWRQRKYEHKPGEAATVCRFMHGAEIDKLCIAGGAGEGLIEEIAAAAKAVIRQQDQKRAACLMNTMFPDEGSGD